MIDEELYQLATEELDSEARNPEVWARACALASDDHDEARFLYTNLRVEEMLSKDGKQRTFSAKRHRREPIAATAETDLLATVDTSSDALVDEELDLPDYKPQSFAPSRKPFGGNMGAATAAATGAAVVASKSTSSRVVETAGSVRPLASAMAPHDSDVVAIDGEATSEIEPPTLWNENTGVITRGVTSAKLRPAKHDAAQEVVLDVHGDVARSRLTPEQQRAHDLTENLQRQAAQMSNEQTEDAQSIQQVEPPILTNTVKDKRPAITKAEPSASSGGKDYNSKQAGKLTGEHTGKQKRKHTGKQTKQLKGKQTGPQLGPQTGYKSKRLIDASRSSSKGRSFMLFKRRGSIKAIKRGVSWPALFLTLPWLLSKAMLGTAFVYSVLWLVTIVGLYVTGTAWLDAGAQTALSTKLWTAGFAAVGVIGLLYIPFRYGNRWAAQKLQDRGFEFKASIKANDKKAALRRLLKTS